MDHRSRDIEGAARFLLDSCGTPDPPVDPIAMARSWGFRVKLTDGPSETMGSAIFLHRHQDRARLRFDCAHELGHFIAGEVGMDPDSEPLANAIASATLLPQGPLKRDLSRMAWDLAELVERYDVSWEAMSRRLVKVVGCVVTIIDNGRITWRARSRWLSGPLQPKRRKLERWEDDLARDCEVIQSHIYAANLVTAYNVTKGDWSRVVLVAGVEEWEALSAPEPRWMSVG